MSDPLVLVRYLDVVLLVLAIPFVVAADVPLLGYAVGAGAWVLQRAVQTLTDKRAQQTKNFKTQVGLNLASSLARAWTVAIAILVVGLVGEREDGLTAAIVVLVAFTIYLGTALLVHALEGTSRT